MAFVVQIRKDLIPKIACVVVHDGLNVELAKIVLRCLRACWFSMNVPARRTRQVYVIIRNAPCN